MRHLSSGAAGSLNVLVVDDSALVRQVLAAVLHQDKTIRVSTAANPVIALRKMSSQRPDVIVLDLEMPEMDGLTFLRRVMDERPIPVVICSEFANRGSERALRALELGAVGIIEKPHVGVQEFLFDSTVRILDAVAGAAAAKVKARKASEIAAEPKLTADAILPPIRKPAATRPTDAVVAIGASTGGTEALHAVLSAMPEDAPGIVMVQHMPEGFTAAFARRLDRTCRIGVEEAAHGDEVLRGRALLAPGDKHMVVRERGSRYFIEITGGPLVSRHRPSVNVLFRSVARAAGSNGVGVILTGMGDDGAEGLAEMKQVGARTLAQSEATCVVFGMPKVAIELGAVDEVVALPAMAGAILKLVRGS